MNVREWAGESIREWAGELESQSEVFINPNVIYDIMFNRLPTGQLRNNIALVL